MMNECCPQKLKLELLKIHENNIFGQLIKIFMITASGAEGISLRNVRFVHLVDPYWHPVRREQVIGRARRICSHNTLPPEMQTVRVYLYLMKFSEKQLTSSEQESIDLKRNDRSYDGSQVFTTDQTLHEISDMKQKFQMNFLVLLNNHLLIVKFIKIRVLYVILLPILFLRKKHSYLTIIKNKLIKCVKSIKKK